MKKKVIAVILAALMLTGCSQITIEKNGQDNNEAENVVITETGEVLSKEELQEDAVNTASPDPTAEAQASTVPVSDIVEPQQEQVITQEDQKEPQGNELQLVFLGDSIFDTYRDGTGIPYRTAVQCQADVYNLAIGGSCATLELEDSGDLSTWTSSSMTGIVNAMIGRVKTDGFADTVAKELLNNPNIDFSATDYFIIEYGMNDFLSARPLDSESGQLYDLHTYAGALRYAVMTLQAYVPDATIILCAPNYAQFYNADGWMIGDGNSVNNGYGTLFDYKGICNYVANAYQTLFFNAYQDLGIDGYTASDYLEDGIHLSDAGRQLYADALAKMILNYEETKNN